MNIARKPRVYEQASSTFVIGTSDVQEAIRVVGISPETHRWAGTDYGLYARRNGLWRAVSDYSPPKDAKPGVVFFGPIRPNEG